MNKIEVSGIEALVCTDIAKRQLVGLSKYKTTVLENPLPPEQWLTHLYEELLDAAVYIKKLLYELERVKEDNKYMPL
jgi:hypothetical protein